MATGAERGGEQAVAAGCTCKPGQTGDPYYEVENDCPLHGLGMLQAMFDGEREARALETNPSD